jgi:hypothetical protein
MAENAPASPAPNDEGSTGLRHEHRPEVVTTLRRLQAAHHWMRWEVVYSRILSVKVCAICGEYDRYSVQECATFNCTVHRICQRPFV